jgi:hypothetical protein
LNQSGRKGGKGRGSFIEMVIEGRGRSRIRGSGRGRGSNIQNLG